MLVLGLPSLAAKDGHGRATGNSSPGKNWRLQLKLLCGIAIFWPWAARGLSGSFETLRMVHFSGKSDDSIAV